MAPTRDDDTPLTVADCARRLGVSMQTIRNEIELGELIARKSTRRSGRTVYRIERAHFETYLDRVWPFHARPKQPKRQN